MEWPKRKIGRTRNYPTYGRRRRRYVIASFAASGVQCIICSSLTCVTVGSWLATIRWAQPFAAPSSSVEWLHVSQDDCTANELWTYAKCARNALTTKSLLIHCTWAQSSRACWSVCLSMDLSEWNKFVLWFRIPCRVDRFRRGVK